MPNVTLTFNLPEDQEEYTTCTNAGNYHSALWDVSQQVFRPWRKHGYPDASLQLLLEECGDKGQELMEKLEALFWQSLSDNNVTLN